MTLHTTQAVTRSEVEDFLFHEAALLDEWKLDEWQALLTDDATYMIPPNDDLEGDHRKSLFIIADDRERIRQRIIRVLDPNCHAEHPKSRTQRLIGNVRLLAQDDDVITVAANFICYRYRRYERVGEYVGNYRYLLKRHDASFRIREKRVFIQAHELGQLGSVSIIL
jgi:p-cumate 2,3-dioxygenase beta subunit